jgi:uncharacterized protein YegP (UPF0339 family)
MIENDEKHKFELTKLKKTQINWNLTFKNGKW